MKKNDTHARLIEGEIMTGPVFFRARDAFYFMYVYIYTIGQWHIGIPIVFHKGELINYQKLIFNNNERVKNL